jgi:superfamily II DNA helicase RecQ
MAAPSEEKVICDKFNLEALTVNQVKSFKALADGKDVFIGTKTRSGKSLSYESIPVIFPGSLVIVIAPLPLVSIMKEQCSKLNKLGFNATYIGKDASESDRIIRGHFEFLFGSREQLVGVVKWREMLKSDVYTENLRALVVDEAHTVIQWYVE